MTIIARNRRGIIQALQSQGFSLVTDLPNPIRIDDTPRGMLKARTVNDQKPA
ncbi:MAG TPA: hypothetical protein VNV36_05340 [Pseudomonas sp.]|uniref:hypothetical protein n=1 Tax=Pseudomonas sp. TaxID=306 RepID=UPI002B78FA81|nr:hypothetical protein [Pseudomonas sp.]HWH86186.1 hypothetical protein [Pseudomonas sp.]